MADKPLVDTFKGSLPTKREKKSPAVASKMDEVTLKTLDTLNEIANNKNHPMHKARGFEAAKIIMQTCAPKRKEVSGSEGGPIQISLAHMFKGNSLPEKPYEIDDKGEVIDGEASPVEEKDDE